MAPAKEQQIAAQEKEILEVCVYIDWLIGENYIKQILPCNDIKKKPAAKVIFKRCLEMNGVSCFYGLMLQMEF